MTRKQIGVLLLILSVSLHVFTACSSNEQGVETEEFLRNHVEWLSAEKQQGRLAGSAQEAASANYIADNFLQAGLEPFGNNGTYLQQFILNGAVTQALGIENHISRNVTGVVRGTSFPERFLIVGAHYDGQGMGGVLSLQSDVENMIHPSADDNASGTAGLLYLAEKFADDPAPISLLFVGFSGKEPGLLGSTYFVDNMNVSPDSLLGMINLDMIGRLQDDLTIFGSDTWSIWPKIIEQADLNFLVIDLSEDLSENGDHSPFWNVGIPVLHYSTGLHNDYHKNSDSVDTMNYTGMRQVLQHTEQVLRITASSENNRNFPEEAFYNQN